MCPPPLASPSALSLVEQAHPEVTPHAFLERNIRILRYYTKKSQSGELAGYLATLRYLKQLESDNAALRRRLKSPPSP